MLSSVDPSFAQGIERIYSTRKCCLSLPECELPFSSWIITDSAEKLRATVAGDSQVRIFDIGDFGGPSAAKNETVYDTHESCIHVLRCHDARVKRIVTEQSPDLFLTVSEVTPFNPCT
jgi:hypothetical protein